MAQGPQVSVVMTAYNADRHLQAAVESVLAQTFGDFEFIIVNDGSTDGTADLLASLAQADSRIQVLTQTNQGIAAASNAGIRRAQTPIIARMDADDISLPDRFRQQMAFLADHSDCVLLGTQYSTMDEDGRDLGIRSEPTDWPDVHAALAKRCSLHHPTVIMRREAVERVGLYRSFFTGAEDHDLFLRLIRVGKAYNLPEPLFRYRLHTASITARKAELLAKLTIVACALGALPDCAEAYRRIETLPVEEALAALGVDPKAVSQELAERFRHAAYMHLTLGNHASALESMDRSRRHDQGRQWARDYRRLHRYTASDLLKQGNLPLAVRSLWRMAAGY